MNRITGLTTAIVAASLLALACGTKTGDKVLVQAQIPGTYTEGEVALLAERGNYLDADVTTGGIKYRFLFDANAVCREVVTDGATVRYSQYGPFGRVGRGEQHCDPVGILSLDQWRNRRGRRPGPVPVPRAQATYHVFYRDDDLIFARGRFPLASELGIAGGQDIVGVFPNVEICQGVLEKDVASMEYRDGGKQVLSLVADDGLCPFQGLALPVPEVDESAADD